jgi:DNA-binding transcriptional LysR family regulator
MGIVLLPRWTVAAYLRSGELVDVFPGVDATHSEFDAAAWLVYPTRRYLPLKVRVFADYLKRAFEHGPPAEAGIVTTPPSQRRARTAGRSAGR